MGPDQFPLEYPLLSSQVKKPFLIKWLFSFWRITINPVQLVYPKELSI